MTLIVSMLAKMDAGQAKAELRALQAELDKGKSGLAGLGDASGRVGPKLADQARHTNALAASNRIAGGSVANLTANLNDVFVMIAAGQNPLQLAMQQGTQITQVLGPMGAAGAAKALGSAFLSAVNPFNLLTLGVIAGGAMIIQWMTGASEETKTLSETVKDAEGSVKSFREQASRSLTDLRKDFGNVNADVLKLHENLTALGEVRALEALANGAAALKDAAGRPDDIAALLNTDLKKAGKYGAFTNREVTDFDGLLSQMNGAKGPEDQLQALEKIEVSILAAAGGIRGMNAEQLLYYGSLLDTETALRRMIQAQSEARREAEVMGANGRQGAMKVADGKQPRFNSEDLAEAGQMLATLQQEAALRDLINQHGRDSAAVALARAEAERVAYGEMVSSLEVAGPLKDELMAAWDAANGLARARIAAAIEAALGPASRLRGILSEAAGFFGSLSAARSRRIEDFSTQYKMYGQGSNAARGAVIADGALYGGNGNGLSGSQEKSINPGAFGAKGGGAAKAEADAVAELVAKLREEAEALQVLDPVQAELLKHRKVLKDATKAERDEVERLVESNQRLKAVQQAAQYASNTVNEFLQGIIVRGQSAGEVLSNLAAQFLAMAANSFITGDGWFADLLGISGPLFGSKKTKLADGGMVYGTGGPRADMIDARLSAGEFVVNARAAQRYRPVLERINAGGAPGFANGGLVGAGPGGRSEAGPSGLVIHVAVNSPTGNEELRGMVRQGIEAGLKEFSSQVLPERVQRIVRSPRIVGA